MKYLITIFTVALVALIVQCSKSSNPTVPITGKWTVSLLTVSGCTNPASNFSQPFGCPGTVAKWCYIYTFNPDGTCSIERTATSTEKDTGTYKINGNLISITFTGSNEAWKFDLGTNTLMFTSPIVVNGCTYALALER